MRKIVISLLLATVAASPAVASAEPAKELEPTVERRSAAQPRQQRAEPRREARSERPSFSAPNRERSERPPFAGTRRSESRSGGEPGVEIDRADIQALRAARRAEVERRRAEGVGAGGPQVDTRAQEARRRDWRRSERVGRDTGGAPVVSDRPRPGTQPPLRYAGRDRDHRWSTNWRHDRRYDWRNHRRHNRWVFNVGIYSDPFGWRYRPYQVGWRMWPSYYGSRYRINDPWMYRLPYAPPGYAWVRYWDDALLVDTWTGTVVDKIPSFFW